MKLALSWLQQWVGLPFNEAHIAEQLTIAGLETHLVDSKVVPFSQVVSGRITQVDLHPNADRLRLCTVDCGAVHAPKQIVCGASNVRPGLMVATALLGATLPSGLTIKPRKIRGIKSEGMLCSLEELGLQAIFIQDQLPSTIWELPQELALGVDLWDYLGLGEICLDVQVTPNRGDCLSAVGIARELSVLHQRQLKTPTPSTVPAKVSDALTVHVDRPEACPRYTGRIILDINPAAKTPWWILKRLYQAGINSLNAIVDITNYVLLEWGAPLHAFDLEKLSGPLEVRLASNEKLHLLNDKIIDLQSDTLVIADHRGPLAVAGIMGGLSSAITSSTVNIFLESAFFTPNAIAGRARHYGLMTEASYRFERGVDPELCQKALLWATQLLVEICGGSPGPVITVESLSALPKAQEITLSQSDVTKVLGIALPGTTITEYLTRLGVEVRSGPYKGTTPQKEDAETMTWSLKRPTWRFDIVNKVDFIEELARLSGYANIPAQLPTFSAYFQPIQSTQNALEKWRSFLADQGYIEVINYSFTALTHQKLLDSETTPVVLKNPISRELNVLRTQLWPGLLATLKYNCQHRRQPYSFFECGTVFSQSTNGIDECTHVGGVIAGDLLPEQWGAPKKPVDFFDIKRIVYNSLQVIDPQSGYTNIPAIHPALHPGQSSRLCRGGKKVGWIGALRPNLYNYFELTSPVYLFEWELNESIPTGVKTFQSFSRFPSIRRDIAFWISKDILFESIRKTIIESAGEYLQDLTLFDIYSAENSSNQRSLALGLIWQHPQRTLIDQEVDAWKNQIMQALQYTWNVKWRAGEH
jgi:phenylalanyl-tRNA synthetase beta chain